MYYLVTLGRLSIHEGSPEGPALLSSSKALAVLAYLCAYRGSSVPRDRIAGLFWPGADRSHARQSLRQALYYLGRRVGDTLVDADDRQLQVRDDLLRADLWELDEAVEEGEWARVLDLYGGPFLAGVEEKLGRELETWVEARNERIWTGVQVALHRLVMRALAESRPARAVELARRYVEMNPFREEAQLALLRSLAAAGRPAAAVQAFESYRALLRSELDDEPGPEITALAEKLRQRVFAPSGPMSNPAGSGPPPTHASRRPGGRWLQILAAGAAVVLVALLVRIELRSDHAARTPLPEGPWAWAAVRGRSGAFILRPDADSVATEPSGLAWREIPAPGGSRRVSRLATDGGYDLVLLGSDGSPGKRLTRGSNEEVPLGWSPDGRLLLFQEASMDTDGVHLRRRIAVLDTTSGNTRVLSELQTGAAVRAEWAPSGAWIVFGAETEDGDPEVFRVHPDGSGLRNLTRSPGFDGEPSWSPDGRWIAYVSDRSGSPSIRLLTPDGSRDAPLVGSGFDEHQPVWAGNRRIVYLSTRPSGTDVWTYDLGADRPRRLTHRGDFHFLRPAPSSRTRPWIEELHVEPAPPWVSPGQWLRLSVRGTGPGGQEVPLPDDAVQWEVGEGSVLRRREPGLLRVEAPGAGRLRVAIPGWRSTELELHSLPLSRMAASPLLDERWDSGIQEVRWEVYGSPSPEVVQADGRFPRALLANGDRAFGSGVVSRSVFELRNGATLEVWARLPFQDRPDQDLEFGLAPEAPPPRSTTWSASSGGGLQVEIASRPEGPHLDVAGRRSPVPPPDSLDSWRRYDLQVDRRGVPSFLVDGRLHWRGAPGSRVAVPDSAHVVVGGRSVGTRVLVGPVTLYRGALYTVSDDQVAE